MTSRDRLHWHDEVPRQPRMWLPIVRAVPEAPIRLHVLSERITGTWMHFRPASGEPGDRGEALPCARPAEPTCPHCQAQLRRYWSGWLACWWDRPARCCLAELTGEAARLANVVVDSPEISLRGMELTLERRARTKRAPVVATFGPGRVPPDRLPPCPDVRSALRGIFGVDDAGG